VTLTDTGRPFANAPGLDARGQSTETLADPLLGWYPRRDGGVGRYSVWHEPLQMQEARADVTRCEVFERLGLIDADQPPSSAGLQRKVRFDVHTPPKKIATAIA
jgi:hypothetical protein